MGIVGDINIGLADLITGLEAIPIAGSIVKGAAQVTGIQKLVGSILGTNPLSDTQIQRIVKQQEAKNGKANIKAKKSGVRRKTSSRVRAKAQVKKQKRKVKSK